MGSAEGHASKNAVQSDEQACMHWNDLHRIQGINCLMAGITIILIFMAGKVEKQ